MLLDQNTGTKYVPLAAEFEDELSREWSDPVQVRLENGFLVLRALPTVEAYVIPGDVVA